MPRSPERQEYWRKKFEANVTRDLQHYEALERMGWTALVIWECETTDAERLAVRLRWFLDGEPVR